MAGVGETDIVDEPALAGQQVAIFQPFDILAERAAAQAFGPAPTGGCWGWPLRRLAASSAEITMFW